MINVDGNREAKNSLKNCIKKRLHSSLVCKSVNKIDYKIPIFDVTNVKSNRETTQHISQLHFKDIKSLINTTEASF